MKANETVPGRSGLQWQKAMQDRYVQQMINTIKDILQEGLFCIPAFYLYLTIPVDTEAHSL